MTEDEVRRLAVGYVRCAEALAVMREDDDSTWDPERNPDEAAYDAVEHAIRRGPAVDAWRLVRADLAEVPDERLDVYAAGPLEDLVRLRGAELVDAIEAEAATDERLRWALCGIWLSVGDLPEEIPAGVVRASGGRIRPFDLRDGGATPGGVQMTTAGSRKPARRSSPDRAAAIAADVHAGHRAAREHTGMLVRRDWPSDDRSAVVALSSSLVLDNPLGFAALVDYELVLSDQQVSAGLWPERHEHRFGLGVTRSSWELEVWGAERWLSTAMRAIEAQGETDASAG